jgi:Zn-dependent protease with chaperone function
MRHRLRMDLVMSNDNMVPVSSMRRYEFQADAFAVDLGKGEGLKGGLLALESTNRSAANVDPLYSAFTYSHPPVPERLQAIDERMKKGQWHQHQA